MDNVLKIIHTSEIRMLQGLHNTPWSSRIFSNGYTHMYMFLLGPRLPATNTLGDTTRRI